MYIRIDFSKSKLRYRRKLFHTRFGFIIDVTYSVTRVILHSRGTME